MLSSALALAILLGSIATTSAQDSLPPCAEECSKKAGALSGCALTDPGCFCKSAVFLNSVESCELASCTVEDQEATLRISAKICASVGGVASINPTLNPSAASVIFQSQAKPTPTAPSDATAAEQYRIASILAQFPPCGKICAYKASKASGCLLSDPGCFCTDKKFLTLSDGCETKSCTLAEQQTIGRLSPDLCANVAGALPSVNPTVNPSAASAKLTSSPSGSTPTGTATESSDAAKASASILASLPLCGVPCVKAALQASLCDLTDKVCVCQNPTFLCPVVQCESVTCTDAENEVISTYTAGYCASIGGRNFHPNCGNYSDYNASSSAPGTPSPSFSAGTSAGTSAGVPVGSPAGNGSVVAPAPTPSVGPFPGQAPPSLFPGKMLATIMLLGFTVGVLAWL